MTRPATSADLRKHPRAQLRLPVRIRWHGPFGMTLEITRTLDVSREGLLIHRPEPCDKQARVWVTFPFDPAAPNSIQPETPARIVRVESASTGGFQVALQLASPPRAVPVPPHQERRAFPRILFALPIFVRPSGTPWPEESMTQDISRGGVRFETSHVYASSEAVLARIPWGEWAKRGEIPGRVVRIEANEIPAAWLPASAPWFAKGTNLASVAVQWDKSAKR